MPRTLRPLIENSTGQAHSSLLSPVWYSPISFQACAANHTANGGALRTVQHLRTLHIATETPPEYIGPSGVLWRAKSNLTRPLTLLECRHFSDAIRPLAQPRSFGINGVSFGAEPKMQKTGGSAECAANLHLWDRESNSGPFGRGTKHAL